MTIKQIEQGSKGSFILDENGERLGEMTYTVAGEKLIIIDHTEVSDKLRGQGAGKKLVLAAVEYARQNNIKVLPLCPFAKVTFDRTPDIQDVVSK
ncbi:MAG: N-acetyltransferase GCN5 [Bacteroidetes bacterium OLB12]|nr:MAG: N-acetyltransferase GCN5 [Bacteroidetes bacterium OLB12]HNR73144.1 GNAT family N-acetyltransferase [Cyclobacteriaceae bacterium]